MYVELSLTRFKDRDRSSNEKTPHSFRIDYGFIVIHLMISPTDTNRDLLHH